MRTSARLMIVLALGALLAACGGTPGGGNGDGDGSNGGGNGQATDGAGQPAATLLAIHGGSTSLMQFVEVGTCFWVLGDVPNLIDVVEIVSCDDEHEYEMFHKIQVPGDAYPGDEELGGLANECHEQPFEDYVGASLDESRWQVLSVQPTEEGWAIGHRTIQCALFDGETEMATGSARDSGE